MKVENKIVLVTGGCGFIGSHIVDKLIQHDNEVVIIDDLSTGLLQNLNSKATLHQGDISDVLFVEKIFQKYKFDFVIHQAATINTNVLHEVPLKDIRNSVCSTVILAKLCLKHKVKNFIFASSVAVYGRPSNLPAREDSSLDPIYSYGIAKCNAEAYLKYFHRYDNLNYQVLRYANVFGPRQPILGEVGVIAIFTDRLIKGKELIIYGDGNQQRDYIYIDDVVNFTLKSMSFSKPATYNVGNGVPVTVNEVFANFKEMDTTNKDAIYHAERYGEIGNFYLDINRALKTGWKPTVSLKNGIKFTTNYFKNCLDE